MSTPTFPTLTAEPEIKNFGHATLIDPVHRVKFCSGASLTRALATVTAVPVRYSVYYEAMENTDKLTLEAWEKDDIEYGGIEFNWTNVKEDTTYLTALLAPMVYTIHPQAGAKIWQVSFNLAVLSEVS